MHCNLITTPCQVWSRSTYPLPSYRAFGADTLRCDLDLWPWTIAVYRMWCNEYLCYIWAQSSKPRRSYCHFSIWPNDLEHVLWDDFHQVWTLSTYPRLNYSVLLLMRYVTLWPRRHLVNACEVKAHLIGCWQNLGAICFWFKVDLEHLCDVI